MSPLSLSLGTGAAHGAVVPIGSYKPVSPTTSVTFNNIPQGYQDLICSMSVRSDYNSATDNVFYRFNGSSSAVYSGTYIEGDGGSAVSTKEAGNAQQFLGSPWKANIAPLIFASGILHVFNYANTSVNKTSLFRWALDANGTGVTTMRACLFASTAAITSLTIFLGGGPFSTGSQINLYGVRAVRQ